MKLVPFALSALLLIAPTACADTLDDATKAFIQAGKYFEKSQFTEAEQLFDKAIELNPSDANEYFCAGVNQQAFAHSSAAPDQNRAHLEKAQSYFEQAVKLNTASVDAHLHLASVQSDLGDYRSSMQHLDAALALPNIKPADVALASRLVKDLKAKIGNTPTPTSNATAGMSNPITTAPQQQPEVLSNPGAYSTDGPPATPFAGFVPIVDPSEKSFTVEVPRGWNVAATLVRNGPIDVRPVVRVESPDGLIHVGFGDGGITPGTVPTALLMRLGYYPGRRYGTSTIAPYTPGAEFAKAYLKAKWKKSLGKYEIIETENHPELAPLWNGTGNTRSDCGSIRVALNYNGADRAYAIAATHLKASAGSSMWWVGLWGTAVYPSDREAGALYVLTHIMQTFRWNPAWQQNSDQVTAMVSADYARHAAIMNQAIMQRYQTIQDTNNIITSGYWGRQAVYNNLSTSRSDAMLGQERVLDPNTGTQYKVNAANEHWTDGSVIINGDGGQPEPYFRKMENAPF